MLTKKLDAVKCMDVLIEQQKFEIELEVMLEFTTKQNRVFPLSTKFC